MDFGDDQDYYAPSSSGATGRSMRYKEPLSIEETTADEQRLVNRALRPGGVTDGMSEAEKLSFAKSLVAKNRREVRERERRKEAAMRMESDSFGYELQALENFRAEKEAREEREKQLAKERRADRAAQRHEEVQARLAALRGGAPPLIRPKGSLPTRMVSRGGTEYELKPIQSSLSSSSSTSAEANEYETLQSEMNNGVSDYHHQHTSSKWASSSSSSSSIKSSSSRAQIEAAIAGNRKLTSMTQEKLRGTASFVSKIGKPTAFAPAPTPAPAPGPTLTLEGKNAEPMMVDRQYVLARPLQLHPWQQPASMRVLKERQREVVEQQERLKEIQKQTQILLEQEQALKARVEAQKREKAKQEKNALMRKAHVPLAPPSGAAVSPRLINDHDVLNPLNTHSVYRSYEDEDVRSPKPGSLYKSPHVSAFKERVGQGDDNQDQHRQEYVEEEEEVGDDEDAVAEIVAAEAAILAQKERLLVALGGSPISSSLPSASGFTTFDTNQNVHPGMKVESSSIDRQQVQHSTNHPRGIPQTSRLLQPSQQVLFQGQLSQEPSKSSPFKEANATSSFDTKQSISFLTQSGIQDSSPSKGTDPLSPGQRKRQERQRQREIEEARDAAEEAAERAAQIVKEASAAVIAAKQAEEAAKDAERALMLKMKMLEDEGPQTATIGPIQKKPQKAEKKVSKSKRINEKLHSDDIDEDNGEGVFIPGLELIGVPLRAETNSIKSSNLLKGVSTSVSAHSNSNALPLQNLVDGDEETFEENDEEVGEGMMEGHNTIAAESDDDAYYAASKIQALVRGRAARQCVSSMRNLDNHIARTHHDAVSNNLNVDTNEEEALALEEAAAVEAMYAAKHEAAAIKLQALQRGRAVRSKRRVMINDGDDLIESVKNDVILVNQDLTLEEKVQLEYAESVSNVYETRHEVAAIRLQALQQGRAVRNKFNFTKTHGAYSTENDVHGAKANKAMKEEEEEDIEEDVLTNQALEAKQKMYEAEHHAAAVKVQALARGRAVRKQARTYHNSSDQSLVNELFDAKELAEAYAAEHHTAATRLQAFQRGRAVRNRMRTSTSNQIEAPLLTEKVADLPLATDSNPPVKVYAAEHNEAAIKLQALQRGRAVRKELHSGRRQLSFMSSSHIEANFSLDGDGEKLDLVEPSVLEEIRSDETVIERVPEAEEGLQTGEGQDNQGEIDQGQVDEGQVDQGQVDEGLVDEHFNNGRVNDGHVEDERPTVDDVDEIAKVEGERPALMSNDSLTGEAPDDRDNTANLS
jgi:hypothetical protein